MTPAVATGWSSNTEFMTAENACMVDCRLIPVGESYQEADGRMRWAEPVVGQAAEYLRRLRDDPQFYREKAEKGREAIRESLGMAACAERIRRRMDTILQGTGQ